MAELLSRLTSVPSQQHTQALSDESYNSQICDLLAYLKQAGRASAVAAVGEYLLNDLDPSTHSLSYLFVLHFHIQSVQGKTRNHLPKDVLPGGGLWSRLVHFLRNLDSTQIRYAGQEWRQLVELVAQAAQAVSKPFLAVPVIRDAILRLDSSSEVFTSVHLLFVKLCLLSKSYHHALPVLNRQIRHLPTVTGQLYQKYHQLYPCAEHDSSAGFITDASGLSAKLTYRDHLQYFLYGAMVYLVLKKWDIARHWLSIVISSPATSSVSKIMVEAYKKWVLASLLGSGKLLSPPCVISSHVMRVYQSLARPYNSLADAFEKGDFLRLRAEVEIAQSIWHIDNNIGLVSQVICAFDRYMILKLGRTFSALTISDVAKQAPSYSVISDEVGVFVASLVMSRNLRGVLFHMPNHSDPTMLRFATTGNSRMLQERYVQERLVKEGRSLRAMAGSIEQCNRGLGSSNENFQFLQKSRKWVDNSGKAKGSLVQESEGDFDGDEDIMGDFQ